METSKFWKSERKQKNVIHKEKKREEEGQGMNAGGMDEVWKEAKTRDENYSK